MTFVFGEFELDPARRELRADGKARSLQPQVFDLLLYLVENHDRLVPKRELLETLWPKTVVTESSIQRAVSLARSALGQRGPELIQTFPRQGYRFVGKIREATKRASAVTLQPRYARDGEVHIAYTTLGEGDIVVVLGWVLPMRAMFKHRKTRSAQRREPPGFRSNSRGRAHRRSRNTERGSQDLGCGREREYAVEVAG